MNNNLRTTLTHLSWSICQLLLLLVFTVDLENYDI